MWINRWSQEFDKLTNNYVADDLNVFEAMSVQI